MRTTTLVSLLSLAISTTTATLTKSFISADQAHIILASAVLSAKLSNASDNIAIVDPANHLVAFLRMDNAFLGSIDLAMKKAKTAILFNGLYGSAQLYPAAQPGQPLYGIEETNGGLVLFGGGLPIWLDGKLIGGVGVSGGSEAQDVAVAKAAVLGLLGATYNAPSK